MAKVTRKLQVTIPVAIAREYAIRPGQEVKWEPAGDVIRVVPAGREAPTRDPAERLVFFDAATARQGEREASGSAAARPEVERGWRREDLYGRGTAR